ncbi:MAG: imidazole glycerol phosphate synthase subunit HisH [Terriglobia bacterium]
MIAILDYGAGNTGSVLKAVKHIGYAAEPADQPECVDAAEKLIFPGQGHFGAMMRALQERRLIESVRKCLLAGKPFLGICLGLQALYTRSDEASGVSGLNVFNGRVRRFENVFKVPHVGWNQIEIRAASRILAGVPSGSYAYFCHSYVAPVLAESVAVTEYGQTFTSVIESGNLWAVQFHPEKSGDVGMQVLRNFLNLENQS